MDWKAFYASELAEPRGREAARAALERHRGGDRRIETALGTGGIASFPHVSIFDAADPIARVIGSIYRMNVKRIVALGVLHRGSLPPSYRQLQIAMLNDTSEGALAFRQFGGAFLGRGKVDTPFGPIEEGPAPLGCAVVRNEPDILPHEFSLDLFLALLAADAQARGVQPPAVTRLYVASTRDPSGGFEHAAVLAQAIGELIDDDDTVCVATGDVVHIGHGYSPPAEVMALPVNAEGLIALIAPKLREMHEAALDKHDFVTAWNIGTQLLSDQRQMLPVIAELLGLGATNEQLHFRLSDYAEINEKAAPCYVGAALNLFTSRPDHSHEVPESSVDDAFDSGHARSPTTG